jgi:hypothetical protein
MATEQTKCDDCKKENCPQRIVGSLCSINKELLPLIDSVGSRDPIMVSRFIVSVVGSEYDRYQKAKAIENIGGIGVKTIVHKNGKEYDVEETKTIDNNVSTLAMNIIKAGKMLNEILNPPKAAPFMQQNNQYNFKIGAVDEIRGLSGSEKDRVLKFIDDKLDAKRES